MLSSYRRASGIWEVKSFNFFHLTIAVQGIVGGSCFISFWYKIFIVCKNKSYELHVLYLLFPVRNVKIEKDSLTAVVVGE